MITLIACVDLANGLGKDNDLLVKLPSDLKRFKKLTSNNVIVMGRKTYESIGKPLPNRTNIVLTRDEDYNPHPDVYVYHNINDVLHEHQEYGEGRELFIIGGQQIYEQFLPYANKIYLTVVPNAFKADTFFPELYEEEWELESYESFPSDEDNSHNHIFVKYNRINFSDFYK